MTEPLILYIPGLKPKPEQRFHREALLRCLTTSVGRLDEAIAAQIGAGDTFGLVDWTFHFYGEHRDIELDNTDIVRVIKKERASEKDIATASSLRRRLAIQLFGFADFLPFVIPSLATEEIEVHIRDYFRYVRDRDGKGAAARAHLVSCLNQAWQAGRPVLLLAHSMGSVIAYDALWELSRNESNPESKAVSLLVTLGSPLGQNTVQRHLFGRKKKGKERFPSNIHDWINIAAIGELTAIDRRLKNDFGEMVKLGLVKDIVDHEVFNYYHMHGNLNVHAEYGYLVNEVTARCVVDWWKATAA